MEHLYRNQMGRAVIEGYTSEGAGVARLDGQAVFVPGAVRGDDCEVRVVNTRSRFAWGRIERIVTPSPARIEPDCPAFPACGGCSLRHMSYEEELWFKENHVRETLRRIGGAEPVFDGIVGAERLDGYRNKAQYPVRFQKGRLTAGFYRSGTHEVIPCGDCRIESPASHAILRAVLDYMRRFRVHAYEEETGRGTVRHVCVRTNRRGEALASIAAAKASLPEIGELTAMLRRAWPDLAGLLLNVNTRRDNVILTGDTRLLWGRDHIEETLLGRRFRLSADSFFQVNPDQTERLYGTAAGYLDGNVGELLDLYCGVGSVGICLADRAERLTGVEIVERAVRDAEENARLNGLHNTRFFAADAGTAAAKLAAEGCRPDAVIVDPPRKGLDSACIDAVAAMAPRQLIYISCNPSTQARDIALLAERGYRAERVTAVDMFPRTFHVETVCLLSKLSEAKHHISVQVDMDELDLTSAESKATYEEIQAWVQEKYGFHVTHLNIAQVKRKHSIIERENYNKPKSVNSRQPSCPEEKERAIEEALKAFRMMKS